MIQTKRSREIVHVEGRVGVHGEESVLRGEEFKSHSGVGGPIAAKGRLAGVGVFGGEPVPPIYQGEVKTSPTMELNLSDKNVMLIGMKVGDHAADDAERELTMEASKRKETKRIEEKVDKILAAGLLPKLAREEIAGLSDEEKRHRDKKIAEIKRVFQREIGVRSGLRS